MQFSFVSSPLPVSIQLATSLLPVWKGIYKLSKSFLNSSSCMKEAHHTIFYTGSCKKGRKKLGLLHFLALWWSTSMIVYFTWLLNHMIYIKMRKKIVVTSWANSQNCNHFLPKWSCWHFVNLLRLYFVFTLIWIMWFNCQVKQTSTDVDHLSHICPTYWMMPAIFSTFALLSGSLWARLAQNVNKPPLTVNVFWF